MLIAVLAFELPKVLKSSGSNSSNSPAPVTATPTIPAGQPSTSAKSQSAALRAALRQPPRDVFLRREGGGSPTTLGSVGTPPGLHDPFASPSSVDAGVAPVAPVKPVKVPTLPGTIIIGTPGAGKVAVQGWIVILASIPTAQGQSSANSFAAQARKAGIDNISILNSSNRKPLRGGYWVVYTGPYDTLAQVSTAAGSVHGAGFGTAYIRELIVYKLKPKTTTTKKKKK
ncbi:MAG: SPOR domain-containing protein [Gaiellaceae bacterium]